MPPPQLRMPLVHNLFFTWDGWPKQGSHLPPQPDLDALATLWEPDGFILASRHWTSSLAQLGFEIGPDISPVFFASRVKGRLDHHLRKCGPWDGFARKVGIRAIGHNVDDTVNSYLARQHVHGDFADPRYREHLHSAGKDYPEILLDNPFETESGRYWFNLHLVAVTESRFRIGPEDFLAKVAAGIPAWASKSGVVLKRFAIMPDHVHLALRGDPRLSSAEIAAGFYRSLNRAAGLRLFSERIYVGTFSGYTKQSLIRCSH